MMDSDARADKLNGKIGAIVDEMREEILEEEVTRLTETLLIEALSVLRQRAAKRAIEMKEASEEAERIHDLMVAAKVRQNTRGVAHPEPTPPQPVKDSLPLDKPKKYRTGHDWKALAEVFIKEGHKLEEWGAVSGFLASKQIARGNGGHLREAIQSLLPSAPARRQSPEQAWPKLKWKCGIDGYLELTKAEAVEHSHQKGHSLELVEDAKA